MYMNMFLTSVLHDDITGFEPVAMGVIKPTSLVCSAAYSQNVIQLHTFFEYICSCLTSTICCTLQVRIDG